MPVQILSPLVIAKIAAGEVVERPSSVIKELIENAIDANATSIEIHLKDAGKELIHIKDNGTGIPKDDLNHLFNRHATSKIQHIDDLDHLVSMGFRGEALYSIAAVADVTVETQALHSQDAWRLHVRGSKRMSLEPCATKTHGTDIKIAELFFNTPARRKFLKSNTSELNQIVNVTLSFTLLYPNKRFLLTHAGKTLLDLKPNASFKERMAATLNLHAKDLLETSQDFLVEKISLHAVLSNINITRHRRDMQYFYINNRPIESRSLSFAMNDVYKAILPPGVFGAFILKINLDPSNVDANIHPSKKEVRMLDESRIISMTRHLVEYTLMQFGGTKHLDHLPMPQGIPSEKIIFGPTSPSSLNDFNNAFSVPPSPNNNLPPSRLDLFHDASASMSAKFLRARYIGSFQNKFLLFEDGGSLLCVDQHAAQERIMFERFTKQVENNALEVQPLLNPIVVKLSINEALHIEDYMPQLKEIGIETTLLDRQTLAIHSQPLLLKHVEASVRTLIAGDPLHRCDRATLAKRACKASIVAGDHLSPLQIEHQRKELLACDDPFTCPHGRPILIELTENFLDKQFLRS